MSNILRTEKFFIHLFICLFAGTINLFAQSESKVLALHQQKFEWLINKNYEQLNELLTEDVEYVHSNGWVQNKSDVINDLKTGKLVLEEIQVKNAVAREHKNTIIVTGNGMFKGQVNGTAFNIMLLYTEVYIIQGRHWKLAQRHACKMPEK